MRDKGFRVLFGRLQYVGVFAFLYVSIVCHIGCRSEGAPADAASESPQDEHDPASTVDRMRELFARGRFDLLSVHFAEGVRATVTAQLRAVDRLQSASDALYERVRDRFGLAASEGFDFRGVADIAGVLSSNARNVSSRVDGARATVVYQIGERVPLESAELVRIGRHWVLKLEAHDSVGTELIKLAVVLERCIGRLDSSDASLEALRKDLDLRASPVIRRLRALQKE